MRMHPSGWVLCALLHSMRASIARRVYCSSSLLLFMGTSIDTRTPPRPSLIFWFRFFYLLFFLLYLKQCNSLIPLTTFLSPALYFSWYISRLPPIPSLQPLPGRPRLVEASETLFGSAWVRVCLRQSWVYCFSCLFSFLSASNHRSACLSLLVVVAFHGHIFRSLTSRLVSHTCAFSSPLLPIRRKQCNLFN